MKEIFELQYKLNEYTLNKIGITYSKLIDNHSYIWIENYRKALSAEYAEYLLEIPDTDDANMELVDILHFLVSLSHLVGITPEEVLDIIKDKSKDTSYETTRMFITLNDLMCSCPYKWWKTGQVLNLERAKTAVFKLWYLWSCMCYKLDIDTIKSLYMEKNKINFERQDSGY